MDGVGYRNTRSYENLERRIFSGVGSYGIPQLAPVDYAGGCEFIGFNYAAGCKSRADKGVHFLYTGIFISVLTLAVAVPLFSSYRFLYRSKKK